MPDRVRVRLVFDRGVDPLADLFVRRPVAGRPGRPLVPAARPRDRPAGRPRAGRGLRDGPEPIRFAAAPGTVESHHDCVERSAERRTFYSYVVDEGGGTVPGLIADHLDPDAVAETTRQEDRQRWRLLVRDGTAVGRFHDALVERLRGGVPFHMCYLRDATRWQDHVAVEAGHYESPRAATLDDIADRVGVPRSTLSYRLRNTESRLVRA